MDTSGFLFVIMTGIAVIVISYALDHIWAAAIPVRLVYYVIRVPGVIMHECSHILGCLVTGARIRNVVFFSKDGGSVTYTRPVVPYIGDVIISTAPLFCIPLLLAVLSWVFASYLGCIFLDFPKTINSVDTVIRLIESISSTFSRNLIIQFNGWFLLYLYLTISLVLSAAPSKQDMKNAAVGIIILSLVAGTLVWSGIPLFNQIISELMHLLEIGFTLGLVYGLIALVISLPLIIWYLARDRA